MTPGRYEVAAASVLIAGTTGVDALLVLSAPGPCLLALAGPCGARGAFLGLATLPELCCEAWAGGVDAQRRLFPAHLDSLRDFPARLEPST